MHRRRSGKLYNDYILRFYNCNKKILARSQGRHIFFANEQFTNAVVKSIYFYMFINFKR